MAVDGITCSTQSTALLLHACRQYQPSALPRQAGGALQSIPSGCIRHIRPLQLQSSSPQDHQTLCPASDSTSQPSWKAHFPAACSTVLSYCSQGRGARALNQPASRLPLMYWCQQHCLDLQTAVVQALEVQEMGTVPHAAATALSALVQAANLYRPCAS